MQLPTLPLEEWKDTKMTIHLYLQIIGKIRLKLTPRKNHWWYVTEYITSKGITTGTIPFDHDRHSFEITLNFLSHKLELTSSKGFEASFPLKDGLSVAAFHDELFELLNKAQIPVNILDKPYDLPFDKSFSEIRNYHHYQKEYVERFWHIMLWVSNVFKQFSGRFYGKTCPVQLYWHHMDLAITRFSGKSAPKMPSEASTADKDAYSHEVISFGFWAGDDNMTEPAFYAYTYPSPEGLEKAPLKPNYAEWIDSNGSPMAILKYHDLLKEKDPTSALLSFLESAYQSGAKLAGWDIDSFTVKKLDEL
ncbi:DUF5996 family protein [Limibacter armeniacum]|uniref:DUF5996 family protein n=1 Tax=Limibacter armeniacum TaxID=466084 RepID=UPI002FE531A5